MMQKIKGNQDLNFFKRILLSLYEFRPTDLVNFDDVVAAAEEFIPSMDHIRFFILKFLV